MMSTGYQSAHAAGTKGECREGRVRHTVTLDATLFEAIRADAMKKGRSISEEMAARLAASREVPLANPGP
jgi:hypothetical protein